ncbi:hypothetical protein NU219Hw_g3216t1 [Hortaea werneckii]
MNASPADETDSEIAAPGSSGGSSRDNLALDETLQRWTDSDTSTVDEDIEGKESAALLTSQRAYSMMLDMQRELMDMQQQHLKR